MSTSIKVPSLPESVADATVLTWHKQIGDPVVQDELLVELETDKVVLELPAPSDGVLQSIAHPAGAVVTEGTELAVIAAATDTATDADEPQPSMSAEEGAEKSTEMSREAHPNAKQETGSEEPSTQSGVIFPPFPGPASRQAAQDLGIDIEKVPGSGDGGRVLREDVKKHAQPQSEQDDSQQQIATADVEAHPDTEAPSPRSHTHGAAKSDPVSEPPSARADELVETQTQRVPAHVEQTPPRPSQAPKPASSLVPKSETAALQPALNRQEKREPMSRLRRTIAQRLLKSQSEAALLSTFNDVDMSAIMAMRRKYRDRFEQTHGTRLGLMSFFVKACAMALEKFPTLNASVDDNDVVYHHFYDIGVAVASPRGLVVPIVRDANRKSFADIENEIIDFSRRAADGSLSLDELSGGTFTITNGGVFGSLLSTPIVNYPQSAILGMHRIEKRPIAKDGEVVVRPMMYLAVSYDHRIIDGQQSVQFLVTVKEILEDPTRLVLAI